MTNCICHAGITYLQSPPHSPLGRIVGPKPEPTHLRATLMCTLMVVDIGITLHFECETALLNNTPKAWLRNGT